MVNQSTQRALQTYSDSEVLMALRRAVKPYTIRKAGEVFGVSGAYMHDVLKRRRRIPEKLANQLGFFLVPPAPASRKWTMNTAARKKPAA